MGRRLRGRPCEAEDGTKATDVFLRTPEAIGEARHFVTSVLTKWHMEALADTAELVTSELASNAVQHARLAAFRVSIERLDDQHVKVAVIDRSTAPPVRQFAADDEDHGRGLALVEAISQRWGTDRMRWGKRVWADLRSPSAVEAPAPSVPMISSSRAQVVYVLILLAVAAAVGCGLAVRS
jgi:anti-sigma regulatory factor (Ser/Thr protein kinase)